jgi:hypothetical protein
VRTRSGIAAEGEAIYAPRPKIVDPNVIAARARMAAVG